MLLFVTLTSSSARTNTCICVVVFLKLWFKPFLAKVQYFVFFTIFCKEGHEGTSIGFVNNVGYGYGSIVIEPGGCIVLNMYESM